MAKEENKNLTERKKILQNSVQSMGKIPPQAIDLEEAILGAIILSPKSLIKIVDLLKPEIFYKNEHQFICSAILSLHKSGKDIDILTVSNDLRSAGKLEMVGGMYAITNLTNRVVNSENIRDHIYIVSQKYIARESIRIGTEAIQDSYEDTGDPFEIVNETMKKLTELQQGTMESTEQTMAELSLQSMKERDALGGEKKEILGYKTGYKLLDRQTFGIKTGELTIIAARPAMGKTAMGVNLAHNMADINKIPVGFISLEMKNGKLYVRFQAKVSKINSNDINLNNLSPEERTRLLAADTKLGAMPIIMNDSSYMHVDEFRAKAIMWVHKYGIKVLIGDYLGLFDGTGFSQELKVGYISRTMKKIAMELDIAVVALAQLSRKVEERANKMPQLSDLRDSGSIEQDADNVWFLYRPEYYKIDYPIEFENYGLKLSPQHLLVIVVAKQREGETGNIPLHVNLSIMNISDHPATQSQIPPENKVKAVQTEINISTEQANGDEPF